MELRGPVSKPSSLHTCFLTFWDTLDFSLVLSLGVNPHSCHSEEGPRMAGPFLIQVWRSLLLSQDDLIKNKPSPFSEGKTRAPLESLTPAPPCFGESAVRPASPPACLPPRPSHALVKTSLPPCRGPGLRKETWSLHWHQDPSPASARRLTSIAAQPVWWLW